MLVRGSNEVGKDPRIHELQLRHMGSAGKRGIDHDGVATLPPDGDVVRRIRPDRWRTGRKSVFDKGRTGQRIDIHLDHKSSVGGLRRRLGNNQSHRFADIPDAALSEAWPRGVERLSEFEALER
jgi:hypothetical protein